MNTLTNNRKKITMTTTPAPNLAEQLMMKNSVEIMKALPVYSMHLFPKMGSEAEVTFHCDSEVLIYTMNEIHRRFENKLSSPEYVRVMTNGWEVYSPKTEEHWLMLHSLAEKREVNFVMNLIDEPVVTHEFLQEFGHALVQEAMNYSLVRHLKRLLTQT